MNRNPKASQTSVLVILISSLITLVLLLATTQSGTAEPEPSHKVISQKGLLNEGDAGIALWHDYGSFALYQISDEAWLQLPEPVRSQVQLMDSTDQLFVGLKVIGKEQVSDWQSRNVEQSDKQSLYVVQFVGPIKEEWLEAVENTGAELVQYIANYGYMVWADATSQQKLNLMAEQGEFVQFNLPVMPSFKLGPTLDIDSLEEDDGDMLVPVTVQLYRHDQVQESEQIVESLLVETISPWEFVLDFQNLTGVVQKRNVALIASLPDTVWIAEHFPRELNDEVQGQIMANNLTANQTAPLGPGYVSWLKSLGLSTAPESYPIVDITDDGIGNGEAADAGGDITLRSLGKADNPSRLAYIANCTSEPNGAGPDGHGHINVSIAGGYDERPGFPYRDDNGYQRGMGINPFGRFAGTRVFDDDFNISGCGGTDRSLVRGTYNRGARIVSNSWGCSSCAGIYNTDSQTYDAVVRDADAMAAGNQELVVLFSAGNSGPESDTIGTPGNAKNVITVGASENVRPTWTDGCNVSPAGSNSVQDIAVFSSRGPAPDGRSKPDIVAPGTHVQGTASTAPNYNGSGTCDPYHPAGQQEFAASSGTSHSAPAVAGYASLVYGFLEQKFDVAAPSPALIKAFIIAHTTYLNGNGAGGNLPSMSQGFGLTNMKAAFDGLPTVIFDQNETVLFDETGETWSQTVTAFDPSQPVRIVMAFTDQPGATGFAPQVNDLNLTVRTDGKTYLGNRMSGPWSSTGGTPDRVNTVEAVYLPSLTNRSVQIEITAFNIAGDGVPGVGDNTDQDFAIVCSNCVQENDFVISVKPETNGVCRPGDTEYELQLTSILGFSDPVALKVENLPAGVSSQFSQNPVTPTDKSILKLSTSNTTEIGSYVIQATGESAERTHSTAFKLDVQSQNPETPDLLMPVNDADDLPVEVEFSWSEVSQAHTYEIQIATDEAFDQIVEEAKGLASTTYKATQLQPGQAYYWRTRAINSCGEGSYADSSRFATKPEPGGCPYGVMPEVLYFNDFEGSTAGWTHRGISDQWKLTDERAHSGLKSFYAVNLASISDQQLISPEFKLPPYKGPMTLQFWNYQSMESNENQENSCFDGAILEISADSGLSWQQLGSSLDSDSVLLSDPYDGIISAEHNNPLRGRLAWCGDPQEWLKSIVRIDDFAGKNVRFRFRLGSDMSIGQDLGHEGWYIDDVLVQECPVLIIDSYLPSLFAP